MKFEDSDLDDDKAAELDRLVRVARTKRPAPNVTSRVAQRLSAAGAFAATASTASTEARPTAHFGATKLAGALALLGLGCAVFASVTRLPESASPAASSTATPIAQSVPSPAPVDDTPSISVDALPSSTATSELPKERPRAVAPRTPSRPPSEPTAAPKPEAEVVLIRRARIALPTDPAGALAILDEHARTFSNGELAQEREVMAVEALAHLDRKPEAKRRAQALLARFPRTPYVARLEVALGEQLPSTVPANTPR